MCVAQARPLMNRPLIFQTDGDFYEWARAHPNGFVLNLRRSLTPDYVVLHKASCSTLHRSDFSPGALTSKGYQKVGALTSDALLKWVSNHITGSNGFTKACSRCKS